MVPAAFEMATNAMKNIHSKGKQRLKKISISMVR
jgi:hypothetical protein